MRRGILLVLLTLLLGDYLQAEGFVSIYTDYRPSRWGQALERSGLISPTPQMTRNAPTVDGGGLSAVLLRREHGDELVAMLNRWKSVQNGQITLSMISPGDVPTLEWHHTGWSARYLFRLEEPPAEMLSLISRFYRGDPYNLGIVREEYRNNYVIRVLSGEDVLEQDGVLSFGEAMLGATLLGDPFQPLWGIKDGMGVLEGVGLLRAALESPEATPPTVEAATLSGVQDGEAMGMALDASWDEFIDIVDSFPGSFPENLYVYTRTVFEVAPLSPSENEFRAPEELLEERVGSKRDFALFYYTVLNRMGYQVRLIITETTTPGVENPIVVFKKKDSPLWGMISHSYYMGHAISMPDEIPGLLNRASVRFTDVQVDEILVARKWGLREYVDWKHSPFNTR